MFISRVASRSRDASIHRLLRRLVQTEHSLREPWHCAFGCSQQFAALESSRCLSTSAWPHGKKTDFQAAYDRIQKKRDRQEKAKDKQGAKLLEVWQGITVKELAKVMNRPIDNVFEAMLYVEGTDDYDHPGATINNMRLLDAIVKKCGFRPDHIKSPQTKASEVIHELEEERDLDVKPRPPPKPSELVPRCPIVTVMGHVDHGKTTLLDALRNTSVVEQEFGGITQHIGAFSVKLSNSTQTVTFLDTPGHAAFSAMRSRGAHVTDIVVLVVAAEDGVMEQTKESIRYANEAKVPIIVAINKCDKPEANIPNTKKGLWTQGIALEEFGGEVQSVCISALKKTGLDTLVETILTQAELMQLKADPKGLVEGVVVEARTDPARGRLCTAIIQRGTLRKGSFLVAGRAWARVRGMFNEQGQVIDEAPPGVPAEIIGWRELPSAGDLILECETETKALQAVRYREQQDMKKKMEIDEIAIQQKMEEHLKEYKQELEKKRALGLRRRIRKKGVLRPKETIERTDPELAVVVKADVDGSLEAILDVLETYHSPQCRLDIVHYGVGNIVESDVNLAFPFGAVIYAFNVRCPEDVKKLAKETKTEIKTFNIIYRLVEDLKVQLTERLPLAEIEEIIGQASVLQGFVVKEGKKNLPVAGCRCNKGTLDRKQLFRVIRGEEVLYEGPLTSMKHLKNEVNTISKDQDCGLGFEGIGFEFQLGDTVLCYTKKKVKQKIDWNPPGF
ncbi:hypothetical protein RvY_17415 [Ramazzottius varieornatus]|uniref:Translation initiation factor IF-2, mitochondrial n=1 Tax=Ramazzottius varieornatus TaxID=947166 RepID=A0A1D1W5Y5_RAMVA|nr:hypothetical protein RvY_17415 [Ramazzottius varieornatus]